MNQSHVNLVMANGEAKMIGRQRSAESLEREFNEYMKCLAESIGCDMAIFNLPSAHGNDRLRWAVLIQERLDEIGAMKRTGVNGGNLTHRKLSRV